MTFKSTRRSRRQRNQQNNEKNDQPFFSKSSIKSVQKKGNGSFFQRKATNTGGLTIGQPNDKYEKEADAMADSVVNNSSSGAAIQKKAEGIQKLTLTTPQEDEKLGTAEQRMEEDKMIQEKPEVQRKDGKEEEEPVRMKEEEQEDPVQMQSETGEEKDPVQMQTEDEEPVQKMEGDKEEEPPVQTKSTSSVPNQSGHQLGSKIKSRKGKGTALPDNTRAEMEQSFGADFSDVNIHTDNDARQMNKELGAQAFTHGQDVYFNSGKYRPETSHGKHLLAHELTHVVQQRGKNAVQKSPAPSVQNGKQEKLEFINKKFHNSFGRFDLTYVPNGPDPESGTVTVPMKVYFKYGRGIKKAIRSSFAKDFESKVEGTWGEKHKLVLRDPKMKPYKTDVKVNVEEVFDKKKANFVIHVAPRSKNFLSNVDVYKVELDDGDATNNEKFRASKTDYFKQVGPFSHDDDTINSDVQTDLDDVTNFVDGLPEKIRNKPLEMDMEYTGRANSIGNSRYNEKLSIRRIDTVQKYLESKYSKMIGLSSFIYSGEKNASKDPKFRRVDVKIDLNHTADPFEAFQNTAAHEAGHMFGLNDEYIKEKDGRFEGDKAGYYDSIKDIAGVEAAEEMQASNSTSIMSHGMEVLRGHYFSFALHLRKLTSNNNWFVK